MTFALLAVYRMGAIIPTPGINVDAMKEFFSQMGGTFLGMIDLFSGGAFSNFSIFALGIMPYISASIILQLLTVVIPQLEKLSKEGELGRKKITQYTRYLTAALTLFQGFGMAYYMEGYGGAQIVLNPGWSFRLMTMITLTTGTVFLMWLGEQITERGIGNGISLIIFAGIVVRFPNAIIQTIRSVQIGSIKGHVLIILLAMMIGVIAVIIFVERAQRKIPIQYPKRVVGRKMYGGVSTHMPLKLNTGGVIPIIFAASLIALPQTVAQFIRVPSLQPYVDWIVRNMTLGMPLYNFIYIGAIVFFCYFYTAIIFNPVNVAEDIKKYGGFIPGIRPGKKTADHIDSILTRLTLVGAIYLTAVAILPEFLMTGIKLDTLPGGLGNFMSRIMPSALLNGLGVPFYFGGTSLLIVVGVAMDTLQQVESQLIMRHYEGFTKKGRIRGRRG
ncbi:MAG: preprotein translocase subunit SecY [Candidatus Fischerbacteria bacterium RBG_13_37_8]|uniref:Protein translocase subunit SecY n=1 Tax=Candidatus Fischerbacteria bacterium RBG_13_37_8 TaxID=1817863 RepID=A0A1F5VFG8_9BACT|nr:MAG: preprotein translocase subunit SecY [Candidatus Fischerbacteria bacterium RBG_13_37_8]